MHLAQANEVGKAIADSRWVTRVLVRRNPQAEGGYCLSVWPRDKGRFGRGLAWTTTRNTFRERFPSEHLPTRNRDLTVEKEENSLRELW